MAITLEPIGFVEVGMEPKEKAKGVESKYEYVSTIYIYEDYVDGLDGLEDYSHIYIIYFMDRVGESILKVRPWGKEENPIVGIFATRFPPRPNPIAISVVELLRIEGPRIFVRGLDAWTGSPVLDIKPYDYYDIVKKPRVPSWFLDKWVDHMVSKRYSEIVPWLGPID
jgi:tRNA-Thr(GGU) m(6)t(6)A37 methyltransferase TsaA